MAYPRFPVFIDLSESRIVVAGAGRIASRRVKALTGFAGDITVIAPRISDELRQLESRGKIRILQRRFEDSDLDGAEMVLAATDDQVLNERICTLCRQRRIPVNNAGNQAVCDFFFPGIAQKEDVVVGVTASGKDHGRAREITEKIRQMLDE